MKTTSGNESGTSGSRGLQFTSIEETSMTSENRIHDAEGVRVTVGDEIQMTMNRERRFGRVLEVRETLPSDTIRPPAVIVGWNDDQRVGEIAGESFENFCRILVSVAGEKTPAAAVLDADPPEGCERDGNFAGDKRIVKPAEIAALYASGLLDPATKCSVCGHALSSCRNVEVDGTDWTCGACLERAYRDALPRS